MKVSIALATYNGERYIAEQLESFRYQKRLPDELVVTDDGSTDATLKIVEEFAASAPFVVRIYKNRTNLGCTQNFARALGLCTGDLIFLSDQDDVWFDSKISAMEACASAHPDAQVIMCDAVLADAELNGTGLTVRGQLRAARLPTSAFVMGCCAALRRDFIRLVMPIPDAFPAHDGWLIGIADGIRARIVMSEPLQYYRRHDVNVSGGIAGSITRVTPLHYYKRRVERMLNDSVGFSEITRLEMLKDGVLGAAGRTTGVNSVIWLEFARRLEVTVKSLHRRAEVRSTSLPRRVVGVVNLWRTGEYRAFNGFSSAVRDLLFK